MKALFQAKEAAQIVDLYADHIEHLMRAHEDMIGPLGSKLKFQFENLS